MSSPYPMINVVSHDKRKELKGFCSYGELDKAPL